MGHNKEPGDLTDYEIALERKDLAARLKLNNSTTAEELAETFQRPDVEALNAYHWLLYDVAAGNVTPPDDTYIPSLRAAPISDPFFTAYPHDTHLLTQNTIIHPDDAEDAIEADPIAAKYLKDSRGSEDLSLKDTLRTRRNTIALLVHLGASAARPAIEATPQPAAMPEISLPNGV